MKEALKKHFIPHEGNIYRPEILSRRNIKKIAGAILAAELLFFVLPTLNFAGFVRELNLGAVLPAVLSTLTNERRQENKLPQLKIHPLLVESAQLKADDMAAKGYFAHTSPEGKTPWYWFQKVGYKYSYAGENLAINFTDSHDVTEAWMNSPSHRANIIARYYEEMGTGVATGLYQGREAVFVAQVYARPRLRAAQPAAAAGVPISAWSKFASSPHESTNLLLYAALGVMLVILSLNIFIKVRHQHKDLIINGALVSLLIIGLHFTNDFIAGKGFQTSFIAFEAPESEQE